MGELSPFAPPCTPVCTNPPPRSVAPERARTGRKCSFPRPPAAEPRPARTYGSVLASTSARSCGLEASAIQATCRRKARAHNLTGLTAVLNRDRRRRRIVVRALRAHREHPWAGCERLLRTSRRCFRTLSPLAVPRRASRRRQPVQMRMHGSTADLRLQLLGDGRGHRGARLGRAGAAGSGLPARADRRRAARAWARETAGFRGREGVNIAPK